MECSFKSGKVVIMLAGRFAGRKAVVVKASDEGTGDKRFGHCVGKEIYSIFPFTLIRNRWD
jgi:ribosomal protein L14E/L6E/L27E